MPAFGEITQLLLDWSNGDEDALRRLIPLVEKELRHLASRALRREQQGHLLQTTALVNEAYLRLVNAQEVNWQNRAHFFAVSAQIMRRILVDIARQQQGKERQIMFEESLPVTDSRHPDLVALDTALAALAEMDERKSRIVELRFFGGLNVEETAEVLKISKRTIEREWHAARAWLYRELSKVDEDET